MAAIKMDELLVSWLGSDEVYENVMELIESYRRAEAARHKDTVVEQLKEQQQQQGRLEKDESEDQDSQNSLGY